MVSVDVSYVLFLHDLRSIYYLECRLVDELGGMAESVSHGGLSDAFLRHQSVTVDQVGRLERVFEVLGVDPEGYEAADFKGIFDEVSRLKRDVADDDLLNLGFAGVAVKVENIEIASYNNLLLRVECFEVDDEVEGLLKENLSEEEDALDELEGVSEGLWFENLIGQLKT